MKPFIPFLFFYLFTTNLFGQGLNGEINFNNSYHQFTLAVASVNEFSYVAKWEGTDGGFTNPVSLVKIDTLENILWDVTVNPFGSEFVWIEKIHAEGDSVIYISGTGQPVCDMAFGCFGFIQKYNPSGVLLWSKKIDFPSCSSGNLTAVSNYQNGGLFYNYSDSAISKIYTLDGTGALADSIIIPVKKLSKIARSINSELIGFKQDTLFIFNTSGSLISQKIFSSDITDIGVSNDSVFAITSDSVFVFDINLLVLNSETVPGYFSYSHLKIMSDKIRFLSSAVSNQTVFTLDHNLNLISQIPISVSLANGTKKDFNNLHFTASVDFNLTEYQSIRILDFSFLSTINQFINSTDIGVIDIQPTQVITTPHSFPGVYFQKVYADILIKNYGPGILNSCRINHDITMAICYRVVYSEEFTGLNLAPGDSLWISCGLIHDELEFLSGTDTLFKNICVYTSHPNGYTDTLVPNDVYCENIVMGFVGIAENEKTSFAVFPNPAKDNITIQFRTSASQSVSIYNSFGQLLFNRTINSGEIIDLSDLANGLYLITTGSNHEFMVVNR